MITRFDLDERVREWGLREEVVEKDYVIGWMLWGIGTEDSLVKSWAFKGGTCLKKCYIETYRFSEDLDFTVLPGGPIEPEALFEIFNRVVSRIHEESGIDFNVKTPSFKMRPSGQDAEGRIYFRGPRKAPTEGRVKFDLSGSERLARSPVARPISHAYPDRLPSPATVSCYSIEEVFAEKIRAMGERGRPRDLYDIINLFRRDGLETKPDEIRRILIEKCESKGIVEPTLESITNSPFFGELVSEWANMLGHQLPELPSFDSFWHELPAFFDWLHGKYPRQRLASAPPSVRESSGRQWTAPGTVSTWGYGFSVEAIRFAAANHLYVELGYKGSVRLIEPYAFRRTKDGHILLVAVKGMTGESRTYRLDRIESARVSQQTFNPRYAIEVGSIDPGAAARLRKP